MKKLISRILSNTCQVNLLRGDWEQFMLTLLESAIVGSCFTGFASNVSIHRLLGDAPTAQVEPAVSFHCQLDTALVTNCTPQVGLSVGKGYGCALNCRRIREGLQTYTGTHLIQRSLSSTHLAQFATCLSIHEKHIGITNLLVVERTA